MARLRTSYAAPLLLLAAAAQAQQGDGTKVRTVVNVDKPAKVDATPERMAKLRVPRGFQVAPFATGLGNVRTLVVAPDGTVYAARREEGDVIMLRDADDDGRADAPPAIVASRPGMHGLAIRDGRLYMATVKEIFVAPIQADGRLGAATMLVGDLPDGGQHPNRTLAFGPDGWLYVSIGSTCNACNETNPEHATLLRMSPDGKTRTIFASGLRNTIGFDWHPRTGELWGFDHGIDDLGDDRQAEELNRIEHGKRYGWPHVFGAGDIHPQTTPQGMIDKPTWKRMSEPMVVGYTAHAAPMQMLFHRGQGMPEGVAGDAFATMRGSWNRTPPSGYEVVRVRFDDGRPTRIEPFLTGFLADGGRTHFARPMGLAVAKDGALLVGDDANGVIYRVAAAAPAANAPLAPLGAPPADPMRQQAMRGVGVPLAMARPETKAEGRIAVQSPAFAQGRPIPMKHSEYADGVSPALSWSAVPGAKSYVLVMEDPDSRPITPFVHWVAWNIPADVTSLPEGLQEQLRLLEPAGMMQGRTSRGSPGYFGPRPPAGDPPHRYHFQLFALDRMLDLLPGSDRDAVLAAAAGHVIARGELVGTYQQKLDPPK